MLSNIHSPACRCPRCACPRCGGYGRGCRCGWAGLGQVDRGAAVVVLGGLITVGLLGGIVYLHQRSFGR